MKLLLLIIIAFSTFVGMVMELYKKKIRKDKADVFEIGMVAWAFSVLFGFIVFMIFDKNSLPAELAASPLLIVLFAVLIYLFQLPACQAIWKPILKKWAERKANG